MKIHVLPKWNEKKIKYLELELYSAIKANYAFGNYTDIICNIKDTQPGKLLTQLRVSGHQFPIDKERYKNIPGEKKEYVKAT